jgi:hypothetical protein
LACFEAQNCNETRDANNNKSLGKQSLLWEHNVRNKNYNSRQTGTIIIRAARTFLAGFKIPRTLSPGIRHRMRPQVQK